MTLWQQVINDAAIRAFARKGTVPVFHLVRRDLCELASEISGYTVRPETVPADVMEIRCMVKCDPLGRAVTVDEWRCPTNATTIEGEEPV